VRRPRVKPEHLPYRSADGRVRIGGDIYGLAAEIEDPYGLVWEALSLMDGQRTADEITQRLQADFPDLRSFETSEIMETLIGSGYVEDAAATPPEELSQRERDRYSRSHAFFRGVDLRPRDHGWEAQIRLKAARVVLLGLGGTGSHAAWALAASGVGSLHCVDADRVELSNLNRQILYSQEDIGRPKAEAAIERLQAANSDITVTGERRHVTALDEVTELIEGRDILALCADEPRGAIRVWASRACAAAGVPWVGGGYDGPLVTVGVFGPGGACYECLTAGEAARRIERAPIDLGGPGVIAPSAGVSGNLVAESVIASITGITGAPPGYIYGVNLIAPDHHVYVRHPPRADCACAA
jgi:molybdopterin/thiamine biosynthesis adenylyltransferase